MHAHDAANAGDATVSDPEAFWQQRYGGEDRVWSGRVNHALAELAADWPPGSSLDLGCGEGGDVLWLAERGWRATGVDLSEHAIARARAAAHERGIGSARFVAADLSTGVANAAPFDIAARHGLAAPFDLVTASFFQSPVTLPREQILRTAAAWVAPRGRLVVIAHAAPPDWTAGDPDVRETGHGDTFPTPESEIAALGLEESAWEIEVADVRERRAWGPHGQLGTLLDTVVSARRKERAPGDQLR